MKILIITQSYLPVLGGLQQAVHSLAQGLRAENHDVRILTMRYPLNLPHQELIDDIPITRLFWATPFAQFPTLPHVDELSYSLLTAPARILSLRQFQKEFVPDVVHLHFPDRFAQLALDLAQKYSARFVVSFHGNDIRGLITASARQQKQMKTILDAVHYITAVSQNLLDSVLEFYPAGQPKSQVVYNSLPDDMFELAESHQHNKPYIFAYGRLESVKGFDLLIGAFADANQISPIHFNLLIAGAGTAKKQLIQLVQNLGLIDCVHFLGHQSSKQIQSYIRGSQFVIVPSRQESFGLVVLETMAQGRRIIATNVGGIPEFIALKDNLLVEPTVESLKNALQDWLSQPNFVSHSEANIVHAQQFRVKQMVEYYMDIYRGLK